MRGLYTAGSNTELNVQEIHDTESSYLIWPAVLRERAGLRHTLYGQGIWSSKRCIASL
jgi:hypothetical protein